MVHPGIEAINVFGGTAYLDVMELARHRNLQTARFKNLLMEEKARACYYSGTAGFQTVINFILSQVSPGAKALIIAIGISRCLIAEGGDTLREDWSYSEPSAGAG